MNNLNVLDCWHWIIFIKKRILLNLFCFSFFSWCFLCIRFYCNKNSGSSLLRDLSFDSVYFMSWKLLRKSALCHPKFLSCYTSGKISFCMPDLSCTMYRSSIVIARYMGAIVTLQGLQCRKQINSFQEYLTHTLHAQRSTIHISSYSVYRSRPGPFTWCELLVTTLKY